MRLARRQAAWRGLRYALSRSIRLPLHLAGAADGGSLFTGALFSPRLFIVATQFHSRDKRLARAAASS